MALIKYANLEEVTYSIGTGDFLLSGPGKGGKGLYTRCVDGDTFRYYIHGVDSTGMPEGEWEAGFGTWRNGNIVERTLVEDSSNNGNKVVFSEGTKYLNIEVNVIDGVSEDNVVRGTYDVNGKLTALKNRDAESSSASLAGDGSPVLSFRKAGNLTTGVGADFAGTTGSGKINLGDDILIPGNTLIPGTSIIKAKFNVRRTGTDASYLDVRFGTTNGTGDTPIITAVQFNAGVNPGDVILDLVISITAGRLTTLCQQTLINVAGTSGAVPSEVIGFNFAVDNYLSLVVSGTTSGNYRCISYAVEVFK